MRVNKAVQSFSRPAELDTTSSPYSVYERFNIIESSCNDKILGGTKKLYIYDEFVYTKEEYMTKQLTKMTDIVIPTFNSETATLEEAISHIVSEVGKKCSDAIYAGVDVTLTDGTIEHFSLEDNDQANIRTFLLFVKNGAQGIPYHSDKNFCKVYSVEDFLRIAYTGLKYVLYHTTYCNHLNKYIRELTDKDTVLSASYGMQLPDYIKTNLISVLRTGALSIGMTTYENDELISLGMSL